MGGRLAWMAVVGSVAAHAAVLLVIPRLPRAPYAMGSKANHPVELRLVRTTAPRPTLPVPPPVVAPTPVPPVPPPVTKPVKVTTPKPADPLPAAPPPDKDVPPDPPQQVVVEPTPSPPVTAPNPAAEWSVPRRQGPGPGTGTGTPNLMLGTAGAARLAIQQGGAVKLEAPPDPSKPSMLQKAEWRFGAFYSRVQELVRVRFKPLEAFKRRAREDNLGGIVSGTGVLGITLDRTGKVLDVVVKKAGSAEFIDEEAVKAVKGVGTFTNPPEALFGTAQTHTFMFNFALTIITPDKVERYMRSNDNVLEAIKNTFTKDGRENIWCSDNVACGSRCAEGEPGVHVRFLPCGAKVR